MRFLYEMLIERINKNRPSWRNNIPSDCKLDGCGFDSSVDIKGWYPCSANNQSAALGYANQHAISQKLSSAWGTE